MSTSSQTIISYKGNQAAMLGWRLDTTRQLWYRTTVFWNVDDQRAPERPPRHLRKEFVPGLQCPRGHCEVVPLREPRLFMNPVFGDNSAGLSSSSSSSSSASSSATGTSLAILHGSHFSPSLLHGNHASSSSAGVRPQGSTSTRSIQSSLSTNKKVHELEARMREPPQPQPQPRARLSLPKLKLTTPEGTESDYLLLGDGFKQRVSGSVSSRSKATVTVTATATAGPEPRREIEAVGDVWNFDEWEAEAARLADVRKEKRGGGVG